MWKYSFAAVVVGTSVVVAWTGCSSSKSGAAAGNSSGSDGSASTFVDQASSLAATCSDPDAGLMPTGGGIFSASDFCTLYLATCQGVKDALTDMTSCLASYNAAASLPSGDMQHCRSNHVCNAAVFYPEAFVMHCGHAIGIGLCN
jgi:hypothetical protein